MQLLKLSSSRPCSSRQDAPSSASPKAPTALMNDYNPHCLFRRRSSMGNFETRFDHVADNRRWSRRRATTAICHPPRRVQVSAPREKELHIISCGPAPDMGKPKIETKQRRGIRFSQKISKVSAILSIFLFLSVRPLPIHMSKHVGW